DPDLAPGLHRVDLLDAVVATRELFEITEPLHVLLERLATRPRPGAREGVGDLDDDCLDRLHLDLAVVRLHRVRDGLGLLVATRDLATDERVRAVDLVRDRLADVVHERRTAGGLYARAQLGRDEAGEVRGLDRVRE